MDSKKMQKVAKRIETILDTFTVIENAMGNQGVKNCLHPDSPPAFMLFYSCIDKSLLLYCKTSFFMQNT